MRTGRGKFTRGPKAGPPKRRIRRKGLKNRDALKLLPKPPPSPPKRQRRGAPPKAPGPKAPAQESPLEKKSARLEVPPVAAGRRVVATAVILVSAFVVLAGGILLWQTLRAPGPVNGDVQSSSRSNSTAAGGETSGATTSAEPASSAGSRQVGAAPGRVDQAVRTHQATAEAGPQDNDATSGGLASLKSALSAPDLLTEEGLAGLAKSKRLRRREATTSGVPDDAAGGGDVEAAGKSDSSLVSEQQVVRTGSSSGAEPRESGDRPVSKVDPAWLCNQFYRIGLPNAGWRRSVVADGAWECYSDVIGIGKPGQDGGQPTSIFFAAHGPGKDRLDFLRFKLNILNQATAGEAQSRIVRALEALLEALGEPLPPSISESVEKLVPFDVDLHGAHFSFRRELGDVPRFNLIVEFGRG